MCLRLHPHVVLHLGADAHGVHAEPDFAQLCGVDDATAVEDDRRLAHDVEHLVPVNGAELVPVRRDDDGLGVVARVQHAGTHRDCFFDCA